MMKKTLAFVALLGLIAVGCGKAKVQVNSAATFPVPLSGETPAFLFPINMSHLGSGGDPLAMGLTVTAGVMAKFGKEIISGQQLFDLVGNLSFELAEGIRTQVQGGSFEMGGPAEKIASDLASLMEAIVTKLVELGLVSTAPKFKYIIALHSHGSTTAGGKLLKVESWGGIYDSETKQVISYIEAVNNFPNKPEAVTASLPGTYNGIISALVSGGQK